MKIFKNDHIFVWILAILAVGGFLSVILYKVFGQKYISFSVGALGSILMVKYMMKEDND